MKHTRWLLILLLTLVLGATGVMAQGLDADNDGVPFRRDQCPGVAGPESNNGCPLVLIPVDPPTQTDTDGDGLPDSDDLCPTVAGPRENRGCPPTVEQPPQADADGDGTPDDGDECPTVAGPRENRGCPPAENPPANEPPVNDPPSSVPPFSPPALPIDGCFVTPANPNSINVRKAPELAADVIGFLLPGVTYAADGYVMSGADVWYVLSSYENSTGDTGYASASVVKASNFCADLTPGNDASTRPEVADDFAQPEPPAVSLCYLSVGYDPAYYGSGYDAQLGNDSIPYGAFYFAKNPGEPIAPGTPISGVVFLNGYHELPPDSPLFFQNPDNAVAVASNPAVISAAMNGGLGVAFDLAFPNPNGGIMATNGTTFYRLSSPEHYGSCGPIVSIDDFATTSDQGVIQPMQCAAQQGTTLLEACWCETSDSTCVNQLTSLCQGGGAYIEAGPDTTACWFDESDSGANTRNPVIASAINNLNNCADDLTVWWAEVPNPYGDPFELHDFGGNCANTFDAVFDLPLETGRTRLIVGRGSDTTVPTDADCDENGVPDEIQFPQPPCRDILTTGVPDNTSAKETAGWWAQVLNLTCGGSDWIIMLEIDEDGDEVVTDAQCTDDLD